mgnify:CR=1 FL=1
MRGGDNMVKRKSLLLSLCIVLVAFITTTITFSLGNPNIEIIYKGEVYESNEKEFSLKKYDAYITIDYPQAWTNCRFK